MCAHQYVLKVETRMHLSLTPLLDLICCMFLFSSTLTYWISVGRLLLVILRFLSKLFKELALITYSLTVKHLGTQLFLLALL
jgi:hypothetical protein